MTCIVGIEDKGKVWIGSDSAGTTDDGSYWSLSEPSKVFMVGPVLMGVTGSMRFTQMLAHSLHLPPSTGRTIEDWLCVDFVNAVRATLQEGGWAKKNQEGEERGGFFLFGYHGRLYCFDDDFSVTRARTKYDAMGSGGRIAKGALFATKRLTPKERITIALKAACAHNVFCKPPFRILSTG